MLIVALLSRGNLGHRLSLREITLMYVNICGSDLGPTAAVAAVPAGGRRRASTAFSVVFSTMCWNWPTKPSFGPYNGGASTPATFASASKCRGCGVRPRRILITYPVESSVALRMSASEHFAKSGRTVVSNHSLS
jgi:hypothetical protein